MWVSLRRFWCSFSRHMCVVDNPLTTAPTVEVLTTPVNLCWKLEGPSTATLKKYPKLAVPNNKQPGETKINWGVMSISAIHQPLHYRVPYLSGRSMVVPIYIIPRVPKAYTATYIFSQAVISGLWRLASCPPASKGLGK